MSKSLSEPLDDEELERLDEFLLDRLDDEAGDRIAAAGGDEGILGLSELDGFLTAIVSGPSVALPSRWLPVVWGMEAPTWDSAEHFQEIFSLIIRHQNSIADALIHSPQSFEPMFGERKVKGKTYLIVDEWCYGYLAGVALDAQGWSHADIVDVMRPIRLWGSEDGWKQIDAMSVSKQEIERAAITPAVRALHRFWLERRVRQSVAVRPTAAKVGRNEPCPCGSGKKYKQCCLH
ncbi:MAG: UPF0149 family protein [Steroidobacteraceae bacterium]